MLTQSSFSGKTSKKGSFPIEKHLVMQQIKHITSRMFLCTRMQITSIFQSMNVISDLNSASVSIKASGLALTIKDGAYYTRKFEKLKKFHILR